MWLVRHKILATAIGLALVSLLLIFVAILPIYQNAYKILTKIDLKSKELETLTTKVSILSQLDPDILQTRVSTLDKALPTRKDILMYLTTIDGLSRQLGLSFGGISLTPGQISEATDSAKVVSKSSGGLQRLETEIKMRGGQVNIYKFLRLIEQVLPLMEIRDIKISVLGDDQYSLVLTLAMLWAESSSGDIKGSVTLFGDTEDKYFNQLAEYQSFNIPSTEFIYPNESDMSSQKRLFTPFVELVSPPAQQKRINEVTTEITDVKAE